MELVADSQLNMKQPDTFKTQQNGKTHRQVSKPLMERRRRARINGCLGELRTLLLQSRIAQSCHRSKLEKADILELTVRHLKALTRAQRPGTFADADVPMSRFYAGYTDCAREVGRFLSTSDGIHNTVRAALLHRLSDRVSALTSGAVPLHHQEPPHLAPFVCHFPGVSDASSSAIDSHLLASLQTAVAGQPVTLPLADSAFSFPLQPRHSPSLGPGVGIQLERLNSEALAKKAHTSNSCLVEAVWRPW